MQDLISRQAAVELIHTLYPSAPIMRRNRERWEERYKPYIEAEKALEQLPSAEPKIIRCKDCKYYKQSEWLLPHMCCHYLIGSTVIRKSDDFCSRAERRTDGVDN